MLADELNLQIQSNGVNSPHFFNSMRQVLRSKIHRAVVTEANLEYVGSITIDPVLIEAVGLWPFEKVLVVSLTNGARLETYVIEGERGSGEICINGAAAHLIQKDQEVIIMGFEMSNQPVRPTVALVNAQNKIKEILRP
ncbi:MAG: aspartate 1-decarboxylase [Verrucomicrobiales bacterium]|jgi:aspartate 1-decarboxylase